MLDNVDKPLFLEYFKDVYIVDITKGKDRSLILKFSNDSLVTIKPFLIVNHNDSGDHLQSHIRLFAYPKKAGKTIPPLIVAEI